MEQGQNRRPAPRLWLWIVAACVVHLAAWASWFVIAAHHPVEEVPLASATGR